MRVLFLLATLLGGCATLHSASPLTGETEDVFLAEVPFVSQTRLHCGPAALAMVANHWGREVTQNELASLMMTPEKAGSLTSDVVGAARRQGFNVAPVNDWPALRLEVKAGHPVIILQNLRFSFYPQWHYAVVLGWDRERDKVFLHTGDKAFEPFPADHVDQTWELAEHWAVVVTPAERLSETGSEEEHVANAAALETLGLTKAANQSFQAVAKKWPESRAALIGLGNTYYALGDTRNAIGVLEKAHHLYPNDVTITHNLAVAYGQSDPAKARTLARETLERADAEQKKRFQETLGTLAH